MESYVARVCAEVREARTWSTALGAELPKVVDSIYFGGGTPSLLEGDLFRRMFEVIRGEFAVDVAAEVTVECAPGQMSDGTLAHLQREGVSRLSFGVQSFVDDECAAVGRSHTGADCRAELRRMTAAGVERLAIDLIVGLPHQTESSLQYSIDEALASEVEHVSMYMLEVDEDSRLGKEAMAGGARYGAGQLPGEDAVADWYETGCGRLEQGGMRQYEISNFAREGGRSRHNCKYWERKPYVGFGLDAHSMLRADNGAVRWANGDEMAGYVGDGLVQLPGVSGGLMPRVIDRIGRREAFEEAMFLGLRMVAGVDLTVLRHGFGDVLVDEVSHTIADIEMAGLAERVGDRLRLTGRGRMASNEVFERLLLDRSEGDGSASPRKSKKEDGIVHD